MKARDKKLIARLTPEQVKTAWEKAVDLSTRRAATAEELGEELKEWTRKNGWECFKALRAMCDDIEEFKQDMKEPPDASDPIH